MWASSLVLYCLSDARLLSFSPTIVCVTCMYRHQEDDRHEERGAASVNGTSNGHKNIDNKRKKTVHHELKVMDVRGSDSTSTETFSSSTNGDQGFDREKPWIADAFQGHHCPICLGATEESTIIESCRHIFCKSCLFKASKKCCLLGCDVAGTGYYVKMKINMIYIRSLRPLSL